MCKKVAAFIIAVQFGINNRGILMIRFIYLFLFCLMALFAKAQKLLPFQPEQDACGAIELCNGYFTTPFAYDGKGKIIGEFYGINNSPMGFENNSIWLKINVAVAGQIVFTISPVDEKDDYDFSVFKVNDLQCPYDVQMLTDARMRYNMNCNFNCGTNPGELSSPGGKIGLGYTFTDTFTTAGIFGQAYNKYIDAKAGDQYLVMVDNFSQSAAGFTIDFAGTTALFNNNGPVYESVTAECGTNYNTLKVMLSQPVLCSSVSANGSDFLLGTGAPAITAATSAACSDGQTGAYTWELNLKLSTPLLLGNEYTLISKKGTDGNTLLGVCGAPQAGGHIKNFKVALPLTIHAGSDTAICSGGSIALNAQLQGVGNARIRWQPTTYLSSNTIVNPVATPPQDVEYVVLVAPTGYPASCQYRDTVRIKVLKGFSIVTQDTVLCRPTKIPIQLKGDSAFTYTWSPSDYLSGTVGMLQNSMPGKSVTYTVKASYPGCTDSVQTISVGLREWPDLVTGDTLICQGQSVILQVADIGNFSHVWSPGLYLSDVTAINPIATPGNSITYRLATSYTGCADSVQSVSIAVEPLPQIASLESTMLCAGSSLQMSPSVTPSSSNYIYKWEPAAFFNNPNILRPSYTAAVANTIQLIISTPNGCADTATQIVNVSPLPVVDAGEDVSVVAGQAFTLQGSVDQIPTTIRWTPTRYLSSDTSLHPTASLTASQNFVLSISDEYGCEGKDSIFITVLKDIHTPNAFSPNGDGINDVWNIPGLSSYQNSKTQVFNRWGQMVFESTGYAKPWNGNFKGSQLPVGVYYYLIDIYNGRATLKGSVTIIR